MRRIPSILPWLLITPLAVSAGMYEKPVVNLDAKTFKTVMATEHAAMVAFVAPWCGHCKALGSEYTAAAQSLSPLIPFYAVDCDEDSNKRLCSEYDVKGFPTVKAFPRAGKGAAKDYQGERKRGALVEYAKGLVPDRVKKMRTDDGVEMSLNKFLEEKPELPHVLLVHPSTPSIPFLWKVLAHRMSGKFHLGYIRDTKSHDVLKVLGVYDAKDTTRDNTRAVAWEAGVTSRTQANEYGGAMKFNALLEWLQGVREGKAAPAHSHEESHDQKPLQTPSSDIAANAARQAKLDEAERRDAERRAKASAQSNQPTEVEDEETPVDDVPEPMPAAGVDDEEKTVPEILEDQPPAPEPEEDAEDEEEAILPTATGVSHEEL